MVNKLFGSNKKVKTVEAAQSDLNKVDELVVSLETKRNELQSTISKINNAMNIIEATILIDPSNANLNTKAKGEKQLGELNNEVQSVQAELDKAREQRQEAQQAYVHSKGEQVKKEHIEASAKDKATYHLSDFAERLGKDCFAGKGYEDLGLAFGFGETKSFHPDSEEFKYIQELGKEINSESDKKGEAIVIEALQAMLTVLNKHGIELTEKGNSLMKHFKAETNK
ncbi:hypothetical protein BG07_1034 [Bacillus pseudomycoides]|uniref:hypothetical protein n=1 Tax=Bacillus TaxID=1386 RepID=UPI00036911BD|nr:MULTISPECIES: hypothetical protein [Bacillus]AIK38815.1 hypothetical protein DJ92_3911 [Bacillus pseudomycoides]AJI16605.1 hypothetical protein BG07_1034 [Bacillus pseudomycoides]